MRYIIIFGVTFLIAALLIFYPRKYLYKYDNAITVDYSTIEDTDAELWTYEMDNDILKNTNYSDKKWVFEATGEGNVNLIFYYDKNEDKQKYKIEYKIKIKNKKIYWVEGKSLGLMDFPNLY